MLGLGLICWLILGSMILARLLFGPPLPPPLYPTLAIEVAPAAVATMAYLALNDRHLDAFAAILAGYGVLMVTAQLRLLPAFARLPFAPSFWAFTFSWAAVATSVLHWLHILRPPGHLVYGYLTLTAITLLIGGIALRTVLAALTVSRTPARPSPAK
jgi:tellurite resistance protein